MKSDTAPIRKHARVVLTTLGLFVVLLGVDVSLGYRKLAAGDGDEHIEGVHVAHPRLGWALQAGSLGRHRSPGNFDVRYRISPDGLRESGASATNRAVPERRLWIFGDSFTFGHGVADDETFASVLAARVLPHGTEVLNAGVMGYGIAQQLQRLLELKDRVARGDVVLFAPLSTDLERSYDHFRYASRHLFRDSKGVVEQFPDWRDGRLVAVALDTPANRVKALLYHAKYTGRGLQRVHQLLDPPGITEETHAMIERAREVAEGQGAHFVLLFLPHPEECLTGRYRVDLSSFDLPDLMHFFPSDPEGIDAIRFPSDSHWNARGHALAATAVASVLHDRGLLEGSE